MWYDSAHQNILSHSLQFIVRILKVFGTLKSGFINLCGLLEPQWRDMVLIYVQSISLFNLELSPLFTCKISRLGNYQNLSYKQFSKVIQNRKLLLLWTRCLWCWCAASTNDLYIILIMENRSDFHVVKNNNILLQ